MAIAAFQAGEPLSALDAVFLNSGGFLFKASGATQAEATAIGVAVDSGGIGDLVRVSTDTLVFGFSGLTPGDYLYLSFTTPGAFVDYNTWASELSTVVLNPFLTRIGRAISTDAVEVELSKPVTILNPTQILLLESSTGVTLDAILQEDGSVIDLEVA